MIFAAIVVVLWVGGRDARIEGQLSGAAIPAGFVFYAIVVAAATRRSRGGQRSEPRRRRVRAVV